MKYDLNNKSNRFAQRTLVSFSETLFTLLGEKAFEDITVNELCEISNYPRATFYNYFEDIYDLLNYCWFAMSEEIKIDDYQDIKPEKRVYILFDRMYAFLDSKREVILCVMSKNKEDGKLIDSLKRYLYKQIQSIMKNTTCTERYTIPYEMVAEHYSNTLQLVLEWCFLREQALSRETAKECIDYLLNGI